MSVEQYFPEAVGHQETLDRLELLATSIAESVDDLFAKWEAFAIKNNSPRVVDPGMLDAFQSSLEKQARTNSVKKPKLMPRQGLTPHKFTPLKMEPDVLGSKQYHVEGYPDSADVTTKSAPSNFRLNTDLAKFEKNRPFNESMREISAALDQQIEGMLAVASERFSWPRSAFSNPHNISQNQVTAIGRICREQSPAKSLEEAQAHWQNRAPLTRKSVVIETSRKIGGGSRTQLDLALVSDDQLATLFEGQLVVVKGKNPKGQMFVVEEIVDLPALKVAQVPTPSDGGSGRVPRVCICNAPASYANLELVLNWIMAANAQQITRDIPSALILIGPLLTDTSADPTGDVQRVADLLKRFRLATASSIPVLLIPHADDPLSTDPLFPQQSYSAVQLSLDQPILALSNPCTFSLDEVALTVSSAATLSDMAIASLENKFRHVLRQRQIYPVYPSPPSTNVSQPRLDLSRIDIAPNVLVMPTKGDSQTLVVDGVLCIAMGDNAVSMLTVAKDSKPLLERIRVDSLKVKEL